MHIARHKIMLTELGFVMFILVSDSADYDIILAKDDKKIFRLFVE